ncbi:hypothetical protein IFO69_13510 [Echinicola sp. CAU 1574]|uniref:Uncharacterized protein n=1 Tax=Echinicola arenosa TaxID=2774144 RepID=A0ABR9AQ95_9BACT|nr:hypothetical protein [Echinicola arenosa]MBD8489769.1 hypothetical protein [Echinicola arenosa]
MGLWDYLGAFYYWVYLAVLSKIQGKSTPAYKDIRLGKGKYNKGEVTDRVAYGLKLKTIGLIVTMLIISIIVKSGI